jgi:diacylglycerol kinase family enzyme
MKALVIFNPHARSGETAERIDAIRLEIAQRLQQRLALEKVDWADTQHSGHATQLASEATQHGYDYIFAGGWRRYD